MTLYSYDPSSSNNQVKKVTSYTTTSTEPSGNTIIRTEQTTTMTVGGGKTTTVTDTVVSVSEDNGVTYTSVRNTQGVPQVSDGENASVSVPEGAKTYYSLTVGGIEYRMALADLVTVTDSNTDEVTDKTLTWDLSPIGALKKGYTYTAEFLVWPKQEAYDYVAGLNNGTEGYEWHDEAWVDEDGNSHPAPTLVYDEETGDPLYYKGGVPGYPSIVKEFPDGPFSVLSNTEQKVVYQEIHAQGSNDTITVEESEPQEKQLNPPLPMPLLATRTTLEKEWTAERNPVKFAQFLYYPNGNPYIYEVSEIKFTIGSGADAVTYTVEKNTDGSYTVTADKPDAEIFEVTQSGNDITNGGEKTTIEILKIDEMTRIKTSPTALTGAKFKLMVYNVNGYENYSGNYGEGVDVDSNGKLIIEDLPDGEYKIVETGTPTGYVKAQNNDIYFQIGNRTVTRYDKAYGETGRAVIPTSDSSNPGFISYVITSSGAAFTVGNEPGAALPATGGPGTLIFYTIGALLTALASIMMLMNKQTNY